MADLDRINELVGNKDFNEAKILIDEALSDEPNNVELLKLAGLTSVNIADWNNAKKYFETVVKYNAEDATSWFYLANCYDKAGDFISAKNSYKKVIELRSEYIEAYKSLCIVLLKLKEFAETIKYTELASQICPEEHLFDFIKGTAFMDSKAYDLAIDAFNLALTKNPEGIEILNSLGTCYMSIGDSQKALEIYNKALELRPQNPMSYFNIGSVYQIQKDYPKSIEYFEKAFEIEEDEKFLAAIAISEVKMNDFDCALKHYKQLSVMCPSKDFYKYNVVLCYEALENYEVAIKMLEEMLYLNPNAMNYAQKLASLYMKTSQFKTAKELYDKVILKNKVTPEILHQYAILSSSLQDTDTAEKMLKKVIRMKPEDAEVHKDLAVIYLNKRLFDYANDEFQTALRLEPNNFEIVFEYGNYLYSTSKNKEAEEYYAKALELEPGNVLALVFMALNKLILNQLDESYEYIQKALKVEPHHEYVQFCAGRILYAKGNYEDAKMYLIKAVEQNPDIETMNTLALTYYQLGDYAQALNIFNTINDKAPNSISVLMDIARCHEALGENDNALDYLNKVTNLFPDNEDAHEMIRRLS